MSFLNRFLKRPALGQTSPPPPGTVTVPDGHRVVAYQPTPLPGVKRSAGGVWIMSQGSASDEPATELERLLKEAEDALRSSRAPVLMVDAAGLISEFFAPADPRIRPVSGQLLWFLDPVTLVGSSPGAALLQTVLRRLHTIRTRDAPDFGQIVYLPEFASAGGRLVAELVSDLGLSVREPELETGAVLVEVHRPEGVILSGLPGTSFAPAREADPFVRQINEEKDGAQEEGDTAKLRRLEEQEREELTRRLAPARGKGVNAVVRASRLRQLLLEAQEGGEEAWQALLAELLQRDIPLLVIVDPKTLAAAQRTWPGQGKAMPVYPDRASLMLSASELGLPPESFAIAEMPARDVFSWMAKEGSAVAINAYRDAKTPTYLWLRAEVVQALSQEKLPPSPTK